MNEGNNGNIGALIGSLIIVILLVVGGYFSWKSTTNLPRITTPTNGFSQPTEAIAPPAAPPQESTEISDIAADAAAIDLAPLDTGLENLDLLVK